MASTVFLHYTQEELNRNFDQRAWVPNALEVIGRYPVLSKATRGCLKHESGVRYGSHPDEVLDVFPAGIRDAPVQVFVHGGAWKNFSKDDYSFVADAFVPAGVSTVILNFSKLPSERLPTVVAQVGRGMRWVREHAMELGIDPRRMYLSAQSSGAHLAATAVQKEGIDFFRGIALVSGPYFLEPVVLSHRAEYVQLSREEVLELSPGLHPDRMPGSALLLYAENDTDEFRRQTEAFASALSARGKLAKLVLCRDVNHFELMEAFKDADHPLVAAIFEQMGIALPATAGGIHHRENS